jgi:hypothetical protein
MPAQQVFAADNEVTIIVNGIKLSMEQPAVIRTGRVLVPLRSIFEALGAVLDWDPKTQTVSAEKEGKDVILVINEKVAKVNKKEKDLDVPPVIINGRTYVPLRFSAESLGATIEWDNDTKTATIEDYRKADYVNGEMKNITVTSTRFYSTEDGIPSYGEKQYTDRFPEDTTKYINSEVSFIHSLPGRQLQIPIKIVVYASSGKSIYESKYNHIIEKDESKSSLHMSWKYDNNKWLIGPYKIEVFCNEKLIAYGKFSIVD